MFEQSGCRLLVGAKRQVSWSRLVAICGLAVMTSCGGGTSSSGSANATASDLGAVDVLIADAPRDDLTAFEVTVTAVSFLCSDGTETDNILAAPQALDLLDLSSQSAFLQGLELPTRALDAARVRFDPIDVLARDLLGQEVPVQVIQSEVIAELEDALTPDPKAPQQVLIHVNLLHSLELDADGSYLFDPVVELLPATHQERELSGLHGIIMNKNLADRQFTLALRHRDHDLEFGRLQIQLDDDTVAIDEQGRSRRNAGFLSSVRRSDRVVVYGRLVAPGVVRARLVIAKAHDRGLVTIAGIVTEVDLASEALQLQIQRIEQGRHWALPVLRRLGSFPEITVSIDSSLIILDKPDPRVGTAADIQVGHRAAFNFLDFDGAPFSARRVIVDDEGVRYWGRIVDDTAMPGALTMNLHPLSVPVRADLVESGLTDVTVTFDGDERVRLNVFDRPTVDVELLQESHAVTVRGSYQGPPDAPMVAAQTAVIRPGGLLGEVTAMDPAGSLIVSVIELRDSFGGDDPVGEVTVNLVDSVRVLGDARSEDELFDLFAGLSADQSLQIRVYGLNDGSGDLLIWELFATVIG